MITFERTIIDRNLLIFNGIENGKLIGTCTLNLTVPYAEVTELTYFDNKAYIIEGLVKSALFYAAQNNCYIGRCNCGELEKHIIRMGFIKAENGYENDIPTILAGTCSECKNNI